MKEYIVKILLEDSTTYCNIIWVTKDKENQPITLEDVKNNLIKPRLEKTKEQQLIRTKTKAEVFTPSHICNSMNNLIDNQLFKEGTFNKEIEKGWVANTNKIPFTEDFTWKDYVKSKRLEVTCGEAPYLVSRYDTVSGEYIPVINRIGLLDRKLRVINENVDDKAEWLEWVATAFRSIYGFEFQGDNLFIARMNLLNTFIDNMKFKFNEEPKDEDLERVAYIISWNIWQMDGLKATVPYQDTMCQIMDWDKGETVLYKDLIGDSLDKYNKKKKTKK